MKTKSTFLIFMLLSLAFVSAPAQVSNIQADFSCSPGQITVTYDLSRGDCPVDLILQYSSDHKLWFDADATSVSGDVGDVASGNNKTIVWKPSENKPNAVKFGKFYFRVVDLGFSGFAVDPDQYVLIGGIKWATRNVAAPGAFAATPESPGMFYQWYQWNRNIGWSATVPGDGVAVSGNGEGIDSDGTAFSGASWDPRSPLATMWCDDPCPSGWRLPTQSELETLLTAIGGNPTTAGTWDSTNKGVKVSGVDKNNAAAYLFLPAAGSRYSFDGTLGGVGSVGHYWSSTQANKGIAYNLDYFYNGSSQVKSENMTSGLSVRCVVEL